MEKTITINPDHLKYSASTSSKKPRRKTPKKTARKTRSVRDDRKISTFKKALMKKIQKHQERQRLKIQQNDVPLKRRKAPKPIIQSKLESQQSKPSFAYLENLKQEYKKRQNKPKSRPASRPSIKGNVTNVLNKPKLIPRMIDMPKTQHQPVIQYTQPKPQPIIHLKDPPVYGILKGGKKPLYSNYRKTLKQQEKLKTQKERSPRHTTMVHHTPLMIKECNSINPQTIRESKLEKVKKIIQTSRKRNINKTNNKTIHKK